MLDFCDNTLHFSTLLRSRGFLAGAEADFKFDLEPFVILKYILFISF